MCSNTTYILYMHCVKKFVVLSSISNNEMTSHKKSQSHKNTISLSLSLSLSHTHTHVNTSISLLLCIVFLFFSYFQMLQKVKIKICFNNETLLCGPKYNTKYNSDYSCPKSQKWHKTHWFQYGSFLTHLWKCRVHSHVYLRVEIVKGQTFAHK